MLTDAAPMVVLVALVVAAGTADRTGRPGAVVLASAGGCKSTHAWLRSLGTASVAAR